MRHVVCMNDTCHHAWKSVCMCGACRLGSACVPCDGVTNPNISKFKLNSVDPVAF